jgi:hypothetical protein
MLPQSGRRVFAPPTNRAFGGTDAALADGRTPDARSLRAGAEPAVLPVTGDAAVRHEPGVAARPRAVPTFPAGLWRRLRAWKRELVPATAIAAVAVVVPLAGFGLVQHDRQVDQHRAALTEAFFRIYAQPPVSESWARLSRVWAAYEPELGPLLDRITAASDAELPERALEWDYTVTRIIEEEGLEGDIDIVFRFYKAVAQCVGVGHCDPDLAAAYFGRDPWAFRNQHYPYLEAAYAAEAFDAYFERIAPREDAG